MDKTVALYGWEIGVSPYDITAEDFLIGIFTTYDEALERGEKLIEEKKISSFDIYE